MTSSLKTNEDPVSERKKLYISERHIPALFEALMAGLMNSEPDNHYDFIIESVTKMKKEKSPIRWDTFIKMHDAKKLIMAARPHSIHNNQSAANYINKKGINELFEAMMTALMVKKPDDHIAFIRECLDKVQNNPNRVRWDLFVSNTSNVKSALPSRPSLVKSRQKPLPPVRTSHSPLKTSQSSARQTPVKPPALPPIDNKKTNFQNAPTILILSSSGSTKLCSRLMERYNQISYLLINDTANIDEDDHKDLKTKEHRYHSVQRAIEQQRSQTRGFIIAGDLEEKKFCTNWLDKLGRIDLVIILSGEREALSYRNLHIIQINANNDFDNILADAIRAADDVFPQDTLISARAQSIETKSTHFTLPIIFCIDNHRLPIEEENRNSKLVGRLSIDDEFEMVHDENEEESNNSFIYTLSERLAEQFSYKHIHYGDFNKILLNFEELKTSIIQSMSTCTGYIIDHFPTSFDDLQKFQTEIGPCSALIYTGEHQTEIRNNELNGIIKKFKGENKAVYVDCRMEVDEIYEDLTKDILQHI